MDEAIHDDDEDDENKHEDFGQLSSKEIDFRETIIKQESNHSVNELIYREASQEGEEAQRKGTEKAPGPQRR